jgi:predicted CXXCH cytochrome family protein
VAASRLRLVLVIAAVGLASGAVLAASRLRVAWIADEPLLPTRFDHKFHTSVACTTCHHNFLERGLGPKRCLPCHKDWSTTEPRRIDTMFHAFCTGCHQERAAAGEKAGPVKACDACHVRAAGPSP